MPNHAFSGQHYSFVGDPPLDAHRAYHAGDLAADPMRLNEPYSRLTMTDLETATVACYLAQK